MDHHCIFVIRYSDFACNQVKPALPIIFQMLIMEGVRLQSVIPAHKNILQLLAATWDGTSPMLIYPYSAQGNFKQYLTKFAAGGLSTHQVLLMVLHKLRIANLVDIWPPPLGNASTLRDHS